MKNFLFIFLSLLFSYQSSAKIFSANLNKSNRESITRRAGHSTAMKLLSDPYPLGGYEGLEYGIILESLPTSDFQDYGDGTADGRTLYYPAFNIGKGLYKNVDLFLNFGVYSGDTSVGLYGAMLRWGFYESERIPLVIALNLHISSSNFNNEVTGDTEGFLIDAGLNFTDAGVYLGVGRVSSKSIFTSDLTDSTDSERNNATDLHLRLGGVYHFRPIFVALEVNRYTITHFSLKLGYRY
ncbi:MAG: hypothetical protein CL674_00450 [Bdellovibrionaceae bacterium]|nr:hypothetical protein [Pseudobdellovibrionaceae bacterium]|tara:strand:- start:52057 stop:52773 length:717 start_codon:yes stop_codon:yes gene_type:complete